jgi:hypothetical protein
VIVYVFLGIAAYMTLKGLLGAFRVEVLEKATVTLPKGQDLPALLGVNRAILAALIGGALIVFVYWSREFRSSFDYTLGGVVTGLVVVGGWYVSGVIGHVAEDPQTLQEAFVRTNTGRMESFSFVSPLAYTLAAFWGGPVFFAGSHAREVLHAYREWAPTLPDEATSSIALLRVPPLPDIPEPIRGQFVVHLRYAHCGDPAQAERLLAPMLAAGPVVMGGGEPTPVLSSDVVHQDPHDPLPFWDHGALLSELSPEVVDRLLAKAGPQVDVPLILVELRQLGGALSREADVPNAVAGRDAEYSLFVLGVMAPGLQEVVPALCASLVDSVAEWTSGGSLVNFLGAAATTPERVGAAWSPEVLERLHKLKDIWDPENVFRYGHALR